MQVTCLCTISYATTDAVVDLKIFSLETHLDFKMLLFLGGESMLSKVKDHQTWLDFYQYKLEKGHMNIDELADLKEYIDKKSYLLFIPKFDSPRKMVISKQSTSKKRIVYTYSKEENFVLKLLTYLLQRKYDELFSKHLYSFRPSKGAKEAIYYLTSQKNIESKWVYKVDISDYFNSIPVYQFLESLRKVLIDEKELYEFFKSLLLNPYVYEKGNLIKENKGIMAGTPISTFFANIYLNDLDHCYDSKIYARYSDDIILFCDTKEQLDLEITTLKNKLNQYGLKINPNKEQITPPNEAWVYLGVSYQNGIIDVAPASIVKLKAKMKRKARALVRWENKKGVDGQKGAKAFIRVFNQKLLENPKENELTWIRWYFPLINTDRSLRVIDQYAQQCVRYVATQTYKKSSYNFKYEDMKQLGYKSLVNAYYKEKE